MKTKKQYIGEITKISICMVLLLSISISGILLYTNLFEEEEAEAQVLKQGSTGSTVREIQTRLKDWGYYNGSVDGIYGPQTAAAVRYFQRRHNLAADGIVGSNTASALGVALAASSSYSNNTHLLARCVYGEARGEPYTGQVAIAAVVLNRVRSPDFPNTISGVIYQPGAFTVVSDGQINLSPNDTAMRAVRDAENGWDPTYGCLFYYNPDTATNAWIRQKTIHLTIGKHVFCL